jgi:hypothetical protein
MKGDRDFKITNLQSELKQVTALVWALAEKCEANTLLLLFLLRSLEDLHREIRENLFQPSLPDTRHHLYSLLREIEETGGWPYIERMKLQQLMFNLSQIENTSESQEASENCTQELEDG